MEERLPVIVGAVPARAAPAGVRRRPIGAPQLAGVDGEVLFEVGPALRHIGTQVAPIPPLPCNSKWSDAAWNRSA